MYRPFINWETNFRIAAKNLNNGDIIERFFVLLQRTTDTLYLSDFLNEEAPFTAI
jgi:hypothetical protein